MTKYHCVHVFEVKGFLINHHIFNSPTTDISHLIHLSSGPVAGFSLKIHASIDVACEKILKSFFAIVHVTRTNDQPTEASYKYLKLIES